MPIGEPPGMRAFYGCEVTYPFVPQHVLDAADSVRASLPNKYCDPKIAADLFHETLDEYLIADDVGTTLADLAVMRAATTHTAAATASAQGPLAVTAYGVLMAILAATEHRLGRKDLLGLKVAVQGLGNVGLPLCGYLRERGALLVVTDTDPARSARAESDFADATVKSQVRNKDLSRLTPAFLRSVKIRR